VNDFCIHFYFSIQAEAQRSRKSLHLLAIIVGQRHPMTTL
jgi:hypothetical protein